VRRALRFDEGTVGLVDAIDEGHISKTLPVYVWGATATSSAVHASLAGAVNARPLVAECSHAPVNVTVAFTGSID